MSNDMLFMEAGPYTLVARFRNGTYRGALWLGGKVVQEVQGDDLDDVWRKLTGALYEKQLSLAAARNGSDPTAEEARNAFLHVEKRLSTGHKAMLRAHLRSKDHNITATQLADAAGYRGYSAANLHYGLLGAMLFAEMPEKLPTRKNGTPIMTCAIASSEDLRGSPEEQWIWKMRPHIVEGLSSAGIL